MKTDFLSIRSVSVTQGECKITATVIFNNPLLNYCKTNIIQMSVASLSVMLAREGTNYARQFQFFLLDHLDIYDGRTRTVNFTEMLSEEWILQEPWDLKQTNGSSEIPTSELIEEFPW